MDESGGELRAFSDESDRIRITPETRQALFALQQTLKRELGGKVSTSIVIQWLINQHKEIRKLKATIEDAEAYIRKILELTVQGRSSGSSASYSETPPYPQTSFSSPAQGFPPATTQASGRSKAEPSTPLAQRVQELQGIFAGKKAQIEQGGSSGVIFEGLISPAFIAQLKKLRTDQLPKMQEHLSKANLDHKPIGDLLAIMESLDKTGQLARIAKDYDAREHKFENFLFYIEELNHILSDNANVWWVIPYLLPRVLPEGVNLKDNPELAPQYAIEKTGTAKPIGFKTQAEALEFSQKGAIEISNKKQMNFFWKIEQTPEIITDTLAVINDFKTYLSIKGADVLAIKSAEIPPLPLPVKPPPPPLKPQPIAAQQVPAQQQATDSETYSETDFITISLLNILSNIKKRLEPMESISIMSDGEPQHTSKSLETKKLPELKQIMKELEVPSRSQYKTREEIIDKILDWQELKIKYDSQKSILPELIEHIFQIASMLDKTVKRSDFIIRGPDETQIVDEDEMMVSLHSSDFEVYAYATDFIENGEICIALDLNLPEESAGDEQLQIKRGKELYAKYKAIIDRIKKLPFVKKIDLQSLIFGGEYSILKTA